MMKQLIEEYLDISVSALAVAVGIAMFSDFITKIFGYL